MRMPSLNVMIGGLAVLGIVVIFAKRPPHSPTGMPMPQAEAPRPVVAPPRRAIVATPAPVPTVATAVWEIPDPDTLPDDSYGRTVRRGRDLITRTSSLIGPDAPDPSMRHAGNGLDCQTCHIQAGTQQFGIPLAGIWGVFPQYIGRENEVRTLEERVNGCMERSMNGRALPVDGAEMKAILTYIRHISAPERVGQSLVGRGTPPLPLPDRAADPVRGVVVYADTCAACHGADGLGQRLEAAEAAEMGRRYLSGWLGGPSLYVERHGRPMLRRRHLRAAIGAEEVRGWLLCFHRAWDEQTTDAALGGDVLPRIEKLAYHVQNRGCGEQI